MAAAPASAATVEGELRARVRRALAAEAARMVGVVACDVLCAVVIGIKEQ